MCSSKVKEVQNLCIWYYKHASITAFVVIMECWINQFLVGTCVCKLGSAEINFSNVQDRRQLEMLAYLVPFFCTLVLMSGITLELNCQNTDKLFPWPGIRTVYVLLLSCHVPCVSGPLTRDRIEALVFHCHASQSWISFGGYLYEPCPSCSQLN